jgi:hypothetical protein
MLRKRLTIWNSGNSHPGLASVRGVQEGECPAPADGDRMLVPARSKADSSVLPPSTRSYRGQSHPKVPATNPAYISPSMVVLIVVHQERRYQIDICHSAPV